jgi:hypothetical protein
MVEAAVALAWTTIDAASEGPLSPLLAATDTPNSGRTNYPGRVSNREICGASFGAALAALEHSVHLPTPPHWPAAPGNPLDLCCCMGQFFRASGSRESPQGSGRWTGGFVRAIDQLPSAPRPSRATLSSSAACRAPDERWLEAGQRAAPPKGARSFGVEALRQSVGPGIARTVR